MTNRNLVKKRKPPINFYDVPRVGDELTKVPCIVRTFIFCRRSVNDACDASGGCCMTLVRGLHQPAPKLKVSIALTSLMAEANCGALIPDARPTVALTASLTNDAMF